MNVALMHRRLTAAMALSALLAFMAGAGLSPESVVAAGVLCFAALRLPPESWAVWIERGSRLVILALCAWMLYVAFVVGGDFLPAVMAMVLFLLAAETLRPLAAKNDTRLYLLSFALLLAATAYYPGVGFAASFIAFIVFATMAMTAGYLRREAERFRVADVRLGRRMMITVGALSGVVLLISASLFVLFPRLPRQWNVQGRGGEGDVMAGFGDEVRLGQHGGRISDNPEIAFRVEFQDSVPAAEQYWRGRSFDRFDGERWTSTRGMPRMAYGVERYALHWRGPVRRMRIFGGPAEANVLFSTHPVLSVQARSAIRVWARPGDDIYYTGSDAPVYAVTAASGTPSDAALRASDERPDPGIARYYLQLPPLDRRVQRLADSLTAGRTSRIDRVRAIERYLSTELSYTLELPETRADATVEGFLFRRRAGHCEYFSTAMVVLLRAAGIPSRNVTGFLGGEWNEYGRYMAVTGNDAHSWVEVWFPGVGWMQFEPTPAGRDAYMGDGAGGRWGISDWFGAVEHRWYKWVVDYNLETQLGMFDRVSDLFSRDDPRGDSGRGGQSGGAGRVVALLIALGVIGGLVVSLRRRGSGPRTAETRTYLALRRAYERAALGGSGGPMQFAERLAAERAPGAAPAGELVRLYVRARFGQEDIGDAGRARMQAALEEARRALRETKRERRGGGSGRGGWGRGGSGSGGAGSGGSAAKETRVLVGR
ncbi:MAG TPA: transglutaminaseTgpA domain-containing protein [Longimicrobium sp.]|nr:transglutaminaseTgpA domain-containing protein [Longimicrobium sp.]